jgi:hypothetical protein
MFVYFAAKIQKRFLFYENKAKKRFNRKIFIPCKKKRSLDRGDMQRAYRHCRDALRSADVGCFHFRRFPLVDLYSHLAWRQNDIQQIATVISGIKNK